MSRLFKKPTSVVDPAVAARYERFALLENPFPSSPYVNQESTDKRINGNVYEVAIREAEYLKIESNFLKKAQADPNHPRLGYIVDTSYIGRGNGKTAFLVNLQQDINDSFCLDISDGQNKCFALYVSPEPGGRTKTFLNLVDAVFQALLRSTILEECIAILAYEAIESKGLYMFEESELADEKQLVLNLTNEDWYKEKGINIMAVNAGLQELPQLKEMPSDFPIGKRKYSSQLTKKSDFEKHYFLGLRKVPERLDFVFNQMVALFYACGFNGAYLLVDDFERIPDFQSARQKRDFALELRTFLFDGVSLAARLGFYNWILVFHAGVPRLIGEAWSEAGVDSRAPISANAEASHIIAFEKLSQQHAALLIERYLREYRVQGKDQGMYYPFTEDAISRIGELSEYNAARILKLCHDLLEKAIDTDECTKIDAQFVELHKTVDSASDKSTSSIIDEEALDLLSKIASEKDAK